MVEEQTVIIVKEGNTVQIAQKQEGQLTITELYSNQEETDSQVVLYCKHAGKQGYQIVSVRPPDSDIFWIMCHNRNIQINILFDTGHCNKKYLISLSHHYTQKMCEAMLGLHALTS